MHCFAKICRLCTENENIKLNLYTLDSDNITLLDKLLTLVPDTVNCTDDLPEYICTICYLQLKKAYAFVQKCLETHKQLIYYSKLLIGLPAINTEHCEQYNSEKLENKPNSILTVNVTDLHNKIKEEFDSDTDENETCSSNFHSNKNLLSSTIINEDVERILKENLSFENLEIIQVKQEKLLECNDNDEEVNSLIKNETSMSSCDVPQEPLNYETEHNSDLRSLINQNITRIFHTDKSSNQITQDVVNTESNSDDENSGSSLSFEAYALYSSVDAVDDCVRNTENSHHDLENISINRSCISNNIIESNINDVALTNEIQVLNNSNNAEIQNNDNVLSFENDEDRLSKSRNCSRRSYKRVNYQESDVSDFENSDDDDVSYSCLSSSTESDCNVEEIYNKSIISRTTKRVINYANKIKNILPSTSNLENNRTMLLTVEKSNTDIPIENENINTDGNSVLQSALYMNSDNDEINSRHTKKPIITYVNKNKKNSSFTSKLSLNHNKIMLEKLSALAENNIDISIDDKIADTNKNNGGNNDSPSSSNTISVSNKIVPEKFTTLEDIDFDIRMEDKITDANKNNDGSNDLPSSSNIISVNNKTVPEKLITLEENNIEITDANKNNIGINNNLPSTSKGLMKNSIKNMKLVVPNTIFNNLLSLKIQNIISENKKVLSQNRVVQKGKRESMHTRLMKLSKTKKITTKITQVFTNEKENDNISDPISATTSQPLIKSGNQNISTYIVSVNNLELPTICSDNSEEIIRTNDNVVNSGNKSVINNISENELPIINSNISEDITKNVEMQSTVDTVNLNMETSDILPNKLPATSTNSINEIPITKTDSGNKNISTDIVAVNNHELPITCSENYEKLTRNDTESILQSKTVSSDNSSQQQNDIEIIEFSSEDDDDVVGKYNELGLMEYELPHPNNSGLTFIYIDDKKQSYFFCKNCNKRFSHHDVLVKHLRRHISEKKFKCDKCDYRSYCPKNLREHMVVHITERNFKCDICNKSYKSKAHLKVHKKLHGEHQFICEICGKAFAREHRLKRHRLLHSDGNPFKCSKCDWVGKLPEYKRRHMQAKHGKTKREFKCDICNKIMATREGFNLHMMKHDPKNLKYECIVCNKKFFNKLKLECHLRLHTGAKPYKCKYCGKAFRMTAAYQNHLRIHTGQKPFKCDVCEKSFTQQITLQVHKRIHTGERPYKCDQCGKTFVQSYTYKLHLKKHEKQSETETSCDSSSSSSESCSSHTE